MKKILAMMMVMLIAVTAVFAAVDAVGPSTIKLDYKVNDKFKPAYSFKYDDVVFAEDNGTFVINDGKENAATDKGIAAGSVEMTLIDNTYANVIKGTTHSMAVTIKVDGTKWASDDEDGNYTSDTSVFTITAFAKNAALEAEDPTKVQTTVSGITTGSQAATATVEYKKALTDRTAGLQIVDFTIAWAADQIAPAGNYTADVVVSVAAN